LKQAPYALHIEVEEIGILLVVYFRGGQPSAQESEGIAPLTFIAPPAGSDRRTAFRRPGLIAHHKRPVV
jgi:hypothetical protein